MNRAVAALLPLVNVDGIDTVDNFNSQTPDNCRLQVRNFESEIPFNDNLYDYVHSLSLVDRLVDPDQFFNDLYRIMKPGGTVDLIEFELCAPAEGWQEYKELWETAGQRKTAWQQPMGPAAISSHLAKSGFHQVTSKTIPIPGKAFLLDIEGRVLPTLIMLEKDPPQYKDMIHKMEQEALQATDQRLFTAYVALGVTIPTIV